MDSDDESYVPSIFSGTHSSLSRSQLIKKRDRVELPAEHQDVIDLLNPRQPAAGAESRETTSRILLEGGVGDEEGNAQLEESKLNMTVTRKRKIKVKKKKKKKVRVNDVTVAIVNDDEEDPHDAQQPDLPVV